MAPPVETFPASELPYRIQISANGKRRKGQDIKLDECELMEMVQYSCWLDGPKKDITICKPIVKLFRKYAFFSSFYVGQQTDPNTDDYL